jgi:ATP-binding cassette subfamily F protein uup
VPRPRDEVATHASKPDQLASAQVPKAKAGSAEERTARKALARLDKQLERLAAREAELHEAIAAHATDPERLTGLAAELAEVQEEKDAAELEWLEAAEVLE